MVLLKQEQEKLGNIILQQVVWENALASKLEKGISDNKNFKTILIENQIASTLFNFYNKKEILFNIYYESGKRGIDFLIKREPLKTIPIEVEQGKK